MPISQTTASWIATVPASSPFAAGYPFTFGAVLWTPSGDTLQPGQQLFQP